MKWPSWFVSFKKWLLSWVPGSKQQVVELWDNLGELVAMAGPVVKSIDTELKPLLQDPAYDSLTALRGFLAKYGLVDKQHEDELKQLYETMPIGDLCLHIALLILKAIGGADARVRMLRLAIELAYNVYCQVEAAVNKREEEKGETVDENAQF